MGTACNSLEGKHVDQILPWSNVSIEHVCIRLLYLTSMATNNIFIQISLLQECLAAEEQLPMLHMLDAVSADKKLIAAHSAIRQFEKLLSQFGGPVEQSRWLRLKSRLLVFCDANEPSDVLQQTPAAAKLCGEASSILQTCPYSSSRVAILQAVSATQKEVFVLGDLQHAVTLTANGRATEFAARQGVKLEVFVHRAVWLTGM